LTFAIFVFNLSICLRENDDKVEDSLLLLASVNVFDTGEEEEEEEDVNGGDKDDDDFSSIDNVFRDITILRIFFCMKKIKIIIATLRIINSIFSICVVAYLLIN